MSKLLTVLFLIFIFSCGHKKSFIGNSAGAKCRSVLNLFFRDDGPSTPTYGLDIDSNGNTTTIMPPVSENSLDSTYISSGDILVILFRKEMDTVFIMKDRFKLLAWDTVTGKVYYFKDASGEIRNTIVSNKNDFDSFGTTSGGFNLMTGVDCGKKALNYKGWYGGASNY